MKNELLENRKKLTNHHYKSPHPKLLTGSLTGKYAVIIDGGKTIVFIADKSKEAETRLKYEGRSTKGE